MSALTRGFELIFDTIAYIGQKGGAVTADINKWLGKQLAPTTSGLSSGFTTTINKLLADWNTLVTFFKAVYKAGAAIAAASVGTGKSIITTLTGMINQFTAFATSVSGKKELTTLMTAHKAQLDALLKLFGALAGAFGKMELAISPTIVGLVTDLAKAFTALLQVKVGHIGEIAATISMTALLASRIGVIKNVLSLILAIATGKVSDLKDVWNILTGKGTSGGLSGSATQLNGAALALKEAAAALKGAAGVEDTGGATGVVERERGGNGSFCGWWDSRYRHGSCTRHRRHCQQVRRLPR